MLHPGDVIGPYTLVRMLGRGASGEVWLAERVSSLLTTQVALKLPLDANPDLEIIRAEAQVWLRASGHTNIVPVLDAEVYDGQVVIASEYVAGGSLASWLVENGGKASSTEAAIAIMRGILSGLAHLHAAQLIHRDLKPENVLLQNLTPRLTDFGLSRVLQPSGHATEMAGTPIYMPPEAFQGRYSPATDLWAAAIILHGLVAGVPPYADSNFYSLLLAITSAEPVTLASDVPAKLAPFLARALAKSPDARYPSASEMLAALDDSLTPAAPTPSMRTTARPAHNLPLQVTSFVGREKEVAELRRLLASARLVTLTAAGGTGKTRLSLQVAEGVLDDYPDGVWLVELATLAEPALVAQATARLLNVQETAGEAILRSLVNGLKSRKMLLILDNCEHVVAACAELAAALLRGCSGLTVLASSREALNIPGEAIYPIPALSLPDPKKTHTSESISQYESVRLFLDRATAVRSDFSVNNQNAAALAQLCYRLDGIPLALELAAARVRSLPIEEINARLDNRFRLLTGGSRTALPRQQTLRALIDWSYDLLNDQERTLLARLSVFAGGWTIAAAERVCHGDPVEDWEVFDLLTALTDKSLVICNVDGPEVRYRMLESLREYGREKLEGLQDRHTTERLHARYYAAIVTDKAEGVSQDGGMPDVDLAWILTEEDNLRAALEWLWRSDEVETAAQFTVSMRQFWTSKGWLREAYSNLSIAVREIAAVSNTALRARIFKDAGWFAFLLGDLPTAERLTAASVDTAGEAGAQDTQANALNILALIAQALDEPDRADALFVQSIALARALGLAAMLADHLTNLAFLRSKRGDRETAQALFAEAKRIYETQSNEYGMAAWLCNQSDVALRQSNWKEALEFAEQSLERFRRIENPLGVAYALANLAEAASRQYMPTLTEASVAESVNICREVGHRDILPNLFLSMARSRHASGDFGGAAKLLKGAIRLRELLQRHADPSEEAELEALDRAIRAMDAGTALEAAQNRLARLELEALTAELLSV